MQVSISYIDPMGMKVVVDLWFDVLSYFHPDYLRKMNLLSMVVSGSRKRW